MREKTITNNILRYLNSLPFCTAEKVSGDSTQSGRPDINACYKGRCLRIEVKSPEHGNIPSKKQYLNLKRWCESGALCIVAYSVDDVKNALFPTVKDCGLTEKDRQRVEKLFGEDVKNV